MKKFLTALLIGAFVFGIGATNIQNVEAKKSNTPVSDELQKRFENGEWKPFHTKDDENGNSQRPPEPPKDENGNPMPPPNHDGNSDRNGDNQRPPEPPKDENGNPMPPPNHDGNNSNVRK